MAVVSVQFRSAAMGRDVSCSLTLPEVGEGRYPVLIQLHGLGDDHTPWLQKSMLQMHVRDLSLAVAMPDGASSGYLNWTAAGRLSRQRYEDLIMIDMCDHLKRHFNVTDGPWAIGGLSMVGYGAMRLGLKYPQRFASIRAHSSAFHMSDRVPPELVEEGVIEEANVYHQAERLVASGLTPPVISFDCGVDDELIQSNRDFAAHLRRLGIDHHYAEHPGGHTWDYWNEHVQSALAQHARVFGLSRGEKHFT